MENFSTVLWIVVIAAAMIFNVVSQSRKQAKKQARQAGDRHAGSEAWPSSIRRYSSQNSTNNGKEDLPMTPEETKWRASVYAPEKIRRKLKLQYWLLGAWSVLAGAWVVVLCTGRDTFGWMTAVVLLAGYANILLGIVNHRRLLAGKKLF